MSSNLPQNYHASKTYGGIPLRNVWLLMLYASDLFRMQDTDLLDVEEMPDDLPDVIAELLAYAVEKRLRRNLHRAYEPRTAVLDRVRGSIDLLGTESRQLIRQGKVACRFEDLTIDTLRNRYVRGALESIVREVSNHNLEHRCSALARHLRSMGVGDRVPSTREASADRFGRHDVDDRFMVAVARLAFDLALPTETRGEQLLGRVDRDEPWLRKLFEHAVYGFYKVVLSHQGWTVSHGRKLRWPLQASTPGLAAILPKMETDIELFHKHTKRKIVIDTKFTTLLKPAQFRDTISSRYLYQIYSYLRSQVDVPPPIRLPEGVLLHPSTEQTIDEAARIQGHVLRFTTVNLAGPPSQLRTDLLRIVDEPVLSH